MEEVFKITPLPCLSIQGTAPRAQWNIPFTFRSITRSKSSPVYAPKGVLSETPALLTRMSIRPCSAPIRSKAVRTCSGSSRLGQMPHTRASGSSAFSWDTPGSRRSPPRSDPSVSWPSSPFFCTFQFRFVCPGKRFPCRSSPLRDENSPTDRDFWYHAPYAPLSSLPGRKRSGALPPQEVRRSSLQ